MISHVFHICLVFLHISHLSFLLFLSLALSLALLFRPRILRVHKALALVRQIASDARHGPQQSDRSLRLRGSLTVPVPRQPSSAHTEILVAKRQAQLKSTRVASVAVGSVGNSSCVRHNPEHRDAFSEATEDSGKQLKTTGSRRRITKRAAKSTEVSLLAQTSQIQLESSSHEHLDGWPSRHGESSKSASGSYDISEVPERCTHSIEHASVLSDGCKDVTHATVDDALHPDGSSLPASASDKSTCVGSSLVLDTSAVPFITTTPPTYPFAPHMPARSTTGTPTSFGRSTSQHTPQDITPTLACMQERSTPIATVHEVPSPCPVVGCALVAMGVQKLSTNRCEVGSVKPVQNEPMNAAPRQQAQKKTMGGHSVVTVPFQKSMMGSSHHSAKKSLMGSSQTHCRTSQQWSDGELLYFTLVADGALPDGFIRDFFYPQPLNDKHFNWPAPMILRQRYFYTKMQRGENYKNFKKKQGPNSLSQQPQRHRPSSSPDSTARGFVPQRDPSPW